MSPQVRETRTKINKMDYIKLKSFLYIKGNHQPIEKAPAESGKIFANNISDKGLISKITKDSYNSTPKKQNI